MASIEHQLNENISIRKIRDRNNGSVWPVWIDKIVFQQLDAGTRLSRITENIEMCAQSLTKNVEKEENPSVSHVRTCRGKKRIFREAAATLRLAQSSEWK